MRVHGLSMMPMLRPGAVVAVDDSAYRERGPQDGEIVAARPGLLGGRAIVKRVAGAPHEQVTLGAQTWTLGEGEYLLLGDALDESLDSRTFGPVRQQELIGRVWLQCWPPKQLKPGYQ